MSHLLWLGIYVYMVISEETQTLNRAFGSGVLTTCFDDISLSHQGIKPRTPARTSCRKNSKMKDGLNRRETKYGEERSVFSGGRRENGEGSCDEETIHEHVVDRTRKVSGK